MIAPRIAFLFVAAAIQAGCSVPIRADIATGMPHPYRVRYELDGGTRFGCGGDPRTLLTGGEWIVESIGGYQLNGEGLSFHQMGDT